MGSYPQTDGDKEDETPLEKKTACSSIVSIFSVVYINTNVGECRLSFDLHVRLVIGD